MTTINNTDIVRRFAQCDCGSTDADYLTTAKDWWTCNACGEEWVADTTPTTVRSVNGPITTVAADHGDFKTTEVTGPGRVQATFFYDTAQGPHASFNTGTYEHLGHQDRITEVVAFDNATWIIVENDEGVRVRINLALTIDVLAAALVKARRL